MNAPAETSLTLPRVVMTVMVRDEVDVIAPMLEHHLAQGIDLIVVTDNGSVDGTREVLAAYAETGRVVVRDYLAHDKNQTGVVSKMASDAATEFGADWVINADADEFFFAVDGSLSLQSALAHIPSQIGSFAAEVVNLTGAPARTGAGIDRLVWQDRRPEDTLMSTVALHAHPTADVIHVAREGVTVQQGNHGVDIPSTGQPDPSFAIEVLHLPWRSYAQYSSKIANTGRSYDSNPTLNPSPRHHGMRDYRFWKADVLEPVYIVRHPIEPTAPDFVADTRVRDSLRGLLQSGTALRPELLAAAVDSPEDAYSDAERREAPAIADVVVRLESEHLVASTLWRDLYRSEARGRRDAEAALTHVSAERDYLRSRPEARARRLVGRTLRAVRATGRRLRRRG